MITHFAQLQLNTVSLQGVKQFYHDQLRFPIIHESDNEIHFQPTDSFSLSFKEVAEPLAPAHLAFEIPDSEFENVVSWLQKERISLLKWSDGRIIDNFETGRNVYFRDGDGNLLEIISHHYIQEGILPPSGALNILYLREIGFPVENVIEFREMLVKILNFKLDKVSDIFAFAIGGTAHCVIPSKKRKWIPISMSALPPTMEVGFGVTDIHFINEVKARLDEQNISYEWNGGLYFKINEYSFCLSITNFPKEAHHLLNLPFSR
ncbi:glyoxalase/bleomycin resistance/dioxygenase family protein [Paenibacillus sp. LMG 31456]|uniref:Glyoxalase/bleomycin resistance/dioxygenase family protein n=1 Tax=Paenibacillus foliorum TaxID=2654974 RepID=A0A972GTV8_9BACL|nr:glyoxalase/bleomycin resistance/dioxygenase family protein [Paenibacillus foliorum]NOU96776.1 glyoxalase/bleomycin resistance/dioxygenase family protein [Paenibacillus foliorum]